MEFPAPYQGEGEAEPSASTYLVLWYHHDGESHSATKQQILQRIQDIRDNKPMHEVTPRLKQMTIIPYDAVCDEAWKKYSAARGEAQKKYDAACDEASKKYDAVCDEAQKKYGLRCDEAWKKYSPARDEAQKKYSAARDEAWKKYEPQVIGRNSRPGLKFEKEKE